MSATKTEEKKRKQQQQKKAGRRKAKPFHAHHHPVPQVMHLNMASGLGILKAVSYLQHCSIFILCFHTVSLPMEGGTSPCSYHATLSCFRDIPEKTLCCTPLLFSIFYFWFLFRFFFPLEMYLWLTPEECICITVMQQMSLWSDLTSTKHCAAVSTQLPLP